MRRTGWLRWAVAAACIAVALAAGVRADPVSVGSAAPAGQGGLAPAPVSGATDAGGAVPPSPGRRLKAAYRCHFAGAILFGLMGLVYLGRKEFMPYHAIAIGKPWSELDAPTRELFLASMKIIGSAWLTLAVALGILLRHGFLNGQRWAVFGVPLVGLMVALPTLLAVLRVKAKTPASPPWPPLAVVSLLFATGLLLSLGAGAGP